MSLLTSRLERERQTVEAMIKMYCRDIHANSGKLCPECKALLDYAGQRLQKCPYHEEKTTCAKCRTHCYKPLVREKIRKIMHYSGPRMIRYHPVLAFFHIIAGMRKEPLSPMRGRYIEDKFCT